MKKKPETEVVTDTVLEKVAEVETTCGVYQIKACGCGAHLRYAEPQWLWESWTNHFPSLFALLVTKGYYFRLLKHTWDLSNDNKSNTFQN